ncbi:glycosyltransferase [Janibacter corallicola]|uniref:glycosyltransferase n=1 Tax=Janibacter corallicola TaxID=415212 RepID=UPI000A9598A6|nr:glycosyltransferase [Janibacter corallicola]
MSGTRRVLSVLRRARRIPRAQWVAHWRGRPVEADTVLYESTFGAGLVDSPYAIFRHLVAAPDMGHLRHVWVVADPERRRRAREHVRSLGLAEGSVRIVGRRTPGYFRHLATAGYLVTNSTFPAELGKRPGQTYVNTWHGTPLKSMGYDTPDGALGAANVIRNFLAADHLVSSGPYMTDTMYRGAYRLEGLAPGSVLEVGQPRTDVQVTAGEGERARIRARLRAEGVAIGAGQRVVLVAPTWRGEAFADPSLDAGALEDLVRELRASIGEDRQVLVKAHPVVHEQAEALPSLEGALVPPDVPANEVLAVTDHLVTDYSSILFDALADPRVPITFHVPDREAYEALRPLYLPAEELPGRVCTTPQEVAAEVAEGGSRPEARREWAARYAPFDDGGATERVVDRVWRGRPPTTGREVPLAGRSRQGRVPRLLIHGGSLQRNGVTSSLIALLGRLDLDAVDVSIAWGPARKAAPRAFAEAIDPRVRLLPRVGGMNGPKRVVWSRRLLQRFGAEHPVVPVGALVRLLQEEWVRCFGTAQFDHVIDFGGYSPYWALLFSRGVAPGPVRTHSIWLHNDLAAEVSSTNEHGRTRAHHLEQVFGLYDRYDRLVSVSESLSRVNERSLGRFAGDARFVSVRNVVDAGRVRTLADADLVDLGLPEGAVAALRDEGTVTVVTAGRLTHEKNQARLVRAAAAVREAGHDVAVVVMGDGPLEGELRGLVAELGLEGSVHLTGHVANPFPVVAAADYFALTSEHEGLPMVILEALALATPVLTTAFSSVEGVVPPGCGVVVPRDDDAVARAMMELVSERPEFATFDVDGWNAAALEEFAAAIDLGAGPRRPSGPRPPGDT